MMKICGLELDFDATSPADLQKYRSALDKMEAEAEDAKPMEWGDASDMLDGYIDMLDARLRLYSNFLDETFGAGVSKKLMGKNPSLTKMWEVGDALAAAFGKYGSEMGARMKEYVPDMGKKK